MAVEHRPGERVQIDWFHCSELRVIIDGEAFPHVLVHSVIPYSNWEWACVSRSESFLSLKIGLQHTLKQLGAVPRICQTDQSSDATHEVKRGKPRRDYNVRYLGLLSFWGMEAAVIGVGKPEQNGDTESAHRFLRQALDQALPGGNRHTRKGCGGDLRRAGLSVRGADTRPSR